MAWVWAKCKICHPVTKVDGTNLIKILQSKFSSAGHLIIMNRCRNVIYHKINGDKTTFNPFMARLMPV